MIPEKMRLRDRNAMQDANKSIVVSVDVCIVIVVFLCLKPWYTWGMSA